MSKKLIQLLILLTLINLFYCIYISEILFTNKLIDEYKYIFYILFFILFLLISINYLNETIKKYFLISFLSIIFVFYIFEIKLMIYPKEDIHKKILNKKIDLFNQSSEKKFDTRSKFEIYKDFKNNGTVITTNPSDLIDGISNDDFVPLSGISNSETIFCNENGYYSTYKSDRFGFNNPDEAWNSESIEYLLIGDSFVHGACVNRPHDITSSLRKVSNSSAINLGYRSNGPLLNLATLIEYSPDKVKNILWFYYEENDLVDLNGEIIFNPPVNFLLNYLNNTFTQNLKNNQNKIDKLIYKKILFHEKNQNDKIIIKQKNYINSLLSTIKLSKTRNIIRQKMYQPHNLNIPSEFEIILKRVKLLSQKKNANLYFVYLPEYNRYKDKNYNNINYPKIKKIVQGLNIDFIDLNENLFELESNPLKFFPFEEYGHYNNYGYKKVAEFIYNFIKE